MEADNANKDQNSILQQITVKIRSSTKSIRIKDETITLEECPICGDLHISDLEICPDTQESILECERQIEEENQEEKYVKENFKYNYFSKSCLIVLLITIPFAVIVYNICTFVCSKIMNEFLASLITGIIIMCAMFIVLMLSSFCLNDLTSKYRKAEYDFRVQYRKNKKTNQENQETA